MDTLYLDYNATTPLDPQVRKAIKISIDDDWANPSSGKKYINYWSNYDFE